MRVADAELPARPPRPLRDCRGPGAGVAAVARAKPGAERVRWVHGYATDLPPLQVDLVTMTANVAQVFLSHAGRIENPFPMR
jgi:predicted nicotinamide N-methyase